MTIQGFGDLALALQTQRQSAALKSTAARLTQELTTGRRQDVAAAVRGDLGPLAAIDRSLALLDAYDLAGTEARGRAATQQVVLDRVQAAGAEVSGSLLQAGSAGSVSFVDTAGKAARDALSVALSALNARTADAAVLA